MKKIVLLTGSEKTKKYPTTAKNMYWESHVFRAAYRYAQIIADDIYIISPKYGVIGVDEIVGIEDEQLEKWPKIKRQIWGRNLLIELAKKVDLQEDRFEILTEKSHYETFIKGIKYYNLPLERYSKSEWLPYIQKLIRAEYSRFRQLEKGQWSAREIHRAVWTLPRYNYLMIDEIPFKEGVYFIIDENEAYAGYPRIVRVGTHKGDGRLKKRLRQHFMTEDKNGSILRKYVGSALLGQTKDDYLEIWGYNSRNPKVYKAWQKKINVNKERAVEVKVSRYLRECTSFCCIEIEGYSERLKFKEKILRSLYEDESFGATDTWLGRFNPMLHIGTYGLWNEELSRK